MSLLRTATIERSSVILGVVLLLLMFLLQFRVIGDVDMYWQITTGEISLQERSIPTADRFSSTHQGEYNPPIYWLSQILYASLVWELGINGLQVLDTSLFIIALLLVSEVARRQTVHPLVPSVAVLLAFFVVVPHHGLRPQTFGMLGFAIVVTISSSHWRDRTKLLALILTILLWQNLHASATVGILYLGLLWVADGVRWLRGLNHNLLYTTLALLLTIPLLFATPTGWHIFEISARNSELARFIGIEEWLPMWNRRTFPMSPVALIVMGMILLVGVRAWRVVRFEELLICSVFLMASLLIYRMTLFWALAMIPISARWIQEAWPKGFFAISTEPWSRRRALLCFIGLAMAFGVLTEILGIPKIDPTIPIDGVQIMQRLGVRGTIYNYREWSGPLISACYPECQVTIDGRIYLYPKEEWVAYEQAARGELSIEDIEKRYRPDAFFLRPSYDAPLMKLLDDDPDWSQVYQDANCVIYLSKRSSQLKEPDATAPR